MTDVLGRLDELLLESSTSFVPVRLWYEAIDEAWPKLRAVALAAEMLMGLMSGGGVAFCPDCCALIRDGQQPHQLGCSMAELCDAIEALHVEVPK